MALAWRTQVAPKKTDTREYCQKMVRPEGADDTDPINAIWSDGWSHTVDQILCVDLKGLGKATPKGKAKSKGKAKAKAKAKTNGNDDDDDTFKTGCVYNYKGDGKVYGKSERGKQFLQMRDLRSDTDVDWVPGPEAERAR
eukprot:964155-Pyramimonas_sp.AAC.1